MRFRKKGAGERRNVCDIYCIGAQKAGTSWLHHAVNVHPDTYVFPNSRPLTSTNKEAHFWDWNKGRGVEWYRTLMTPPNSALKAMDFTPEYALLTRADVEECRALSPEAKIIYMLRDPVCRAISAIRMHYRWENVFTRVSFDNLLAHVYRKARVKAHSQYVRNYKKWERVFGEKNIKAFLYEDIVRDPHRLLAQVHDFLDLSPSRMDGERRGEQEKRIAKKVWEGERYPVDDLTVFFLSELLEGPKSAAEEFFGIKFTEAPSRG
jgi:hypothetical protein